VAAVHRAVVDESGQVIGVVGESEDVSCRHGPGAELRESRDELELALAAGGLGILRWDRSTGRISLDATAEAHLGLSPGTFAGTVEAWLAMVHPDDRARVASVLARAATGRDGFELEYRVLLPDGSVRWLSGRSEVTVDGTGAVTGRIGCVGDVSERRRADEEHARLLAGERAARERAETAAASLRALQEVTSLLVRALDPQAVAEAVLHEGVGAVRGRSGSICLLAADGATVELVHQIGYREEVRRRWRSFPLDAAIPAADVIRSGEMVLLSSAADRDARYPVLGADRGASEGATAVLPLLDEDGSAFGAMVVGFAEPHGFAESERRFLMALADQCATAMRRAALYETARQAAEAERHARLVAEQAQARLAFLADASTVLSSSALDLEATLARIVELAVPRLADWCAIHLVHEHGGIRPLTVAHSGEAMAEHARQLTRFAATPDASVAAVVRTGEPRITRCITPATLERVAQSEEHLLLLRQANLHGSAIFPLRAGRRVMGALSLATQHDRELDDEDLKLAEELAVRAGTAIDNARLFAERSRVARSLQASLLPASLPDIPGLELAARYAPEGLGAEVGGDFYDAFRVESGWMLVVGDVRGKGLDAAALTGLARHTIRSVAMSERSPAAILTHLNRVLLAAEAERAAPAGMPLVERWELGEPRFCTVAVVAVAPDAAGAAVVACSAGHPLPLIARAGGCIEVAGRPGSLIGAMEDVELHEVATRLSPGDVLVCFTDGITERHHGDCFFDDRGVVGVLTGASGKSAAAIAGAVEKAARSFVPGSPHDDMAVLVLRVPE
jgi:PAS domain S-box-containing protein